MEQALGRELAANEIVVHLDGNKTNNVMSNLVLMTRKDTPQERAKKIADHYLKYPQEGLIMACKGKKRPKRV